MAFKLAIKFLFLLVAIQMGCEGAARKGKPEDIISKKLKSATPAQLNKYKMDAAKRLVADVSKAMQVVSTNADVPSDVQNNAKLALQGLKSGKLTASVASALPAILQQGSNQQGKPVEQLQTILGQVIPNSPTDLKNPLQGTLSFLTNNLGGVTNLLGKLTGAVPDLLSGTVRSLSGSLGAASDSLNGGVGSLGGLMGGLLNG